MRLAAPALPADLMSRMDSDKGAGIADADNAQKVGIFSRRECYHQHRFFFAGISAGYGYCACGSFEALDYKLGYLIRMIGNDIGYKGALSAREELIYYHRGNKR